MGVRAVGAEGRLFVVLLEEIPTEAATVLDAAETVGSGSLAISRPAIRKGRSWDSMTRPAGTW